MKQLKTLVEELDLSSKQKRRKATELAARLVDRIHHAESWYMWRMPRNLRGGGAYRAAEEDADILEDALLSLREAYFITREE